MLNDALKLAKLGIAVFPLSPGSKIPLKNTHGVKDATKDLDKIRIWWRHAPNANIGVALGTVSGIVAVDIDRNHGATDDDLRAFPRTVRVKTRNGYHLYFRHPGGQVKNQVLVPGRVAGDEEAAAYLRADGYYVVGPGSIVNFDKGVRLPDHEYSFDSDAGGELSFTECPIAELPAISSLVDKTVSELPKGVQLCNDAWPSPGVNQASGNVDSRGKYGPNTRHAHFKDVAVCMRKRNHSAEKIREELHRVNLQECNPPKTEEEGVVAEIDNIVKWVMETVTPEPPPVKADAATKDEKKPESKAEKLSPIKLAYDFVRECDYADDSGVYLRYHNDDFYIYRDNYYQQIHQEEIESDINHWLDNVGLGSHTGGDLVGKIIKCLRIKPMLVARGTDLPVFIDGNSLRPAKHIVPLANGLLDMRAVINGAETALQSHTRNFFSSYCLPFAYDPNATCPTFDQVAASTFGDDERRLLWEEIMGVHIFQPFAIERFFMLQGEGANGKSVLVTVLRALLGEENTSSVPLECFHPGDFTFPNTYGKIANIISDQHDIEDVNEGLLKQFVTREPMTFNRKHKAPFTAKPTAFLTICTNNMPRFADKSDGVWRRLILFSLKNQVAEGKQDSRLISPEFWKASGELPGVFNRAIQGLIRVACRGSLGEVASVKQDANEYRRSLDPVGQFIEDCVKFDKYLEITSPNLYDAYCVFVRRAGMRPLGRPSFNRQFLTRCNSMGQNISEPKKIRIGGTDGNMIRTWSGLGLESHAAHSQVIDTGLPTPSFGGF